MDDWTEKDEDIKDLIEDLIGMMTERDFDVPSCFAFSLNFLIANLVALNPSKSELLLLLDGVKTKSMVALSLK